jgi:PAS domain S-box-containing protein
MTMSKWLGPSNRHAVLRYGVAVLCVLAAIVSLWLMATRWQAAEPVPVFLLAVIISTWIGGTKPGLLAMGLALLAFVYLFVAPASLLPVGQTYLPHLVLFTIIASFVVWIMTAERRSQETHRRAHDELERSNETLRADINARKQAEETLRESERKLKEAERLANIGYWDRDLLADRITWSEELGRICGRPTAKLVLCQADLREMIHPDDRHRQEDTLAKAMQGHGCYDLEYRVIRPDGEVRFVHVRDEVVKDPSGRPIRLFGTVQDISDRKQVEEALRDSECKLKEAEQLANIGYWECDIIADRITGSEQAWRIFGLQSADRVLSEAQLHEIIHPDDRPLQQKVLAEAMEGQQRFDCEYRIVRPDGEVRVIRACSEIVRDASGRPLRMFGAVADITERKRVEETLRDSERRLKQAEAIAHVGYWERDMETGHGIWSDELCRITGLSLRSNAVTITQWQNLIHPEDRQRVVLACAEAEATMQRWDAEYRIVRPDGDVRFIESHGEILRDGQGRSRRRFGIAQDITERKRAEEALRESEGKLKEAERLANIGYWEFDVVADRIAGSEEACRIFQCQGADLALSKARLRGLIHPDDRPFQQESLTAALEGRRPYDCEYRIARPDGEVRFVRSCGEVVRDESGRPLRMFGAVQDITERKRAEEAIRETRDHLQQLSRRLLDVQEEERLHLARELHDEFGQLLATITVHVHAAKGLAGEAAYASLDECLALLRDAGEQVRSLALELRPTMLETSGLDAALRWLVEQHRERTGIAVEIVGYANGVSGDVAIACFRVAQEALTNVVRHARAQHVWIELSKSESTMDLIVRDDGVGFDVTTTRERVADGECLGLLGMNERVQILGGSLEVDSQPGNGTRIRAAFPLDVPVDERADLTE